MDVFLFSTSHCEVSLNTLDKKFAEFTFYLCRLPNDVFTCYNSGLSLQPILRAL